MPTILTHSLIGVSAGKILNEKPKPLRFWLLSIVCSTIVDADVIAFNLGIPYSHFFGHRGFFHSPFFAFLVGIFIVCVFFQKTKLFSRRWWGLWCYFSILTASHGILDAFTDGGLGIALLSPFTNERFFSPWRPIAVSPIGIGPFLRGRGFEALLSEFVWVWLPLFAFFTLKKVVRNRSEQS